MNNEHTTEPLRLDDEGRLTDAGVVFRAVHVAAAVLGTGARPVHHGPASAECVLLVPHSARAPRDVTSCAAHVVAAFWSGTLNADVLTWENTTTTMSNKSLHAITTE